MLQQQRRIDSKNPKVTKRRNSKEEKEKKPKHADFRHKMAAKKMATLRHSRAALVGDVGTGRNTIIRRFVDMNSGAFTTPDLGRSDHYRTITVDLSERGRILETEHVTLGIYIFTVDSMDFRALHHIISNLKSVAVVFDVGNNTSFYNAILSMVKIQEMLGTDAPFYVLVANKVDRPQAEVTIAPERVAQASADGNAARYYGCSARQNLGMDLVLDAVLVMAFGRRAPRR